VVFILYGYLFIYFKLYISLMWLQLNGSRRRRLRKVSDSTFDENDDELTSRREKTDIPNGGKTIHLNTNQRGRTDLNDFGTHTISKDSHLQSNGVKVDINHTTPSLNVGTTHAGHVDQDSKNINLKGPHVNIATPKIDVKGSGDANSGGGFFGKVSKLLATTTKAGDTNVKIQTPTINTGHAEHESGSLNVKGPKVNLDMPKIDMKSSGTAKSDFGLFGDLPKVNSGIFHTTQKNDEPNIKLDVPKVNVSHSAQVDHNTGGLNVKVPKVNLNIPKIDIPKPDVGIIGNIPKVNSGIKVEIPKVNSSNYIHAEQHQSSLNLNGPKLNLDLPKVDISGSGTAKSDGGIFGNIPKVNSGMFHTTVKGDEQNLKVDVPKITAEHVDHKSGGLNLNTPHVNLPTPKLDIPHVNLPKLDIKGGLDNFPKLNTGIFHTTNKDDEGHIKVDAPTVNITNGVHADHDPAGLNLKGPKINLETPKINVKGPGVINSDVGFLGNFPKLNTAVDGGTGLNLQAPSITTSKPNTEFKKEIGINAADIGVRNATILMPHGDVEGGKTSVHAPTLNTKHEVKDYSATVHTPLSKKGSIHQSEHSATSESRYEANTLSREHSLSKRGSIQGSQQSLSKRESIHGSELSLSKRGSIHGSQKSLTSENKLIVPIAEKKTPRKKYEIVINLHNKNKLKKEDNPKPVEHEVGTHLSTNSATLNTPSVNLASKKDRKELLLPQAHVSSDSSTLTAPNVNIAGTKGGRLNLNPFSSGVLETPKLNMPKLNVPKLNVPKLNMPTLNMGSGTFETTQIEAPVYTKTVNKDSPSGFDYHLVPPTVNEGALFRSSCESILKEYRGRNDYSFRTPKLNNAASSDGQVDINGNEYSEGRLYTYLSPSLGLDESHTRLASTSPERSQQADMHSYLSRSLSLDSTSSRRSSTTTVPGKYEIFKDKYPFNAPSIQLDNSARAAEVKTVKTHRVEGGERKKHISTMPRIEFITERTEPELVINSGKKNSDGIRVDAPNANAVNESAKVGGNRGKDVKS